MGGLGDITSASSDRMTGIVRLPDGWNPALNTGIVIS